MIPPDLCQPAARRVTMDKHMNNPVIYIGTSGWHYNDWIDTFYPRTITGYNELTYHAKYFNTVENNSSFYRTAGESTYKTWRRMTPDGYRFSMKLHQSITHYHRLKLDDEVKEKIHFILDSTQVLEHKLGAILIQLPPSFRYDIDRLRDFLRYFHAEMQKRPYRFDIAIEFRHDSWLRDDIFDLLRRFDVALVAAQSSRYPNARELTAPFAYIRMHGPGKLFASKYSTKELAEWARYIKGISVDVSHIYVYFNNDFHGYAIENAKELRRLLV
jgi:uncharacterized protein YecE (DUF72 family)